MDSRGAYILTYDSDPQDLSATAIPMAEIQSLVDDELSKVGRVVLMADVAARREYRQSENRQHRQRGGEAGRGAGSRCWA